MVDTTVKLLVRCSRCHAESVIAENVPMPIPEEFSIKTPEACPACGAADASYMLGAEFRHPMHALEALLWDDDSALSAPAEEKP
jgi:hypothetical protein